MFALPLSAARRNSGFGADEVQMCDTTFTFGQRGNHYFHCPSQQDYTRLPQKLAALLSSAQVNKVHHVTLGHENSFLLTWRDQRGHDHIDSQGLPTDLTTFIFATTPRGTLQRSVPNIRLTLGPYNASFFVTDGSAYLWMNLPASLLTALQLRIKSGSWYDRPRIVALGADESFLLMTEHHAAVWDLGHYPLLSEMLEFSRKQKNGIEEVKNVVLHSYRYQCFVAESWNGTLLHNNLPPHELAGVEGMRVAVLKEVQDQQKLVFENTRMREQERMRDREKQKEKERTRRPELTERASLKRDWGEKKQEFTAKAKGRGMKLSLSLSITAKGLAGGMGLR